MKLFAFLVAVFTQLQDIHVVAGQCDGIAKLMPDLERRSSSYSVSGEEAYVRDSILRSGWYVGINNGLYYDMIYTAPQLESCGTFYPVFIQGTKPSLADGEERDFVACLVGLNDNCKNSYNIKIRKCGSEIHYFLTPTDGPSAYCFEQTTTGTGSISEPEYRITGSIKVGPALMYIKGSDANYPELDFKCHFSGSFDYFYEVSWFVNGHFEKSSHRYNMTEIDQTNINETTLLAAGYGLGITLQCGVRISSHIGGTQTHIQMSETFFAGIKVLNKSQTIVRGESAVIQLQQTVPVGCKDFRVNDRPSPCEMEIQMFDPNTSYTCSNTEIGSISSDVDHKVCGSLIMAWRSDDNRICLNNHHPDCANIVFPVINLTISTVNDGVKYRDDKTFSVHLRTYNHSSHKFWKLRFIDIIQVHVAENTDRYHRHCSVTGDPQMEGFVGAGWTLGNVDEVFILYRQKSLGLEVQIQTFPCSRNSGSCVCAVAVRAGGDVFIMDVCSDVKPIHYKFCRSNVMSVWKISDTQYDIYFPIGTMVSVRIHEGNERFLDIQINPTPFDSINRPDGLCGSLSDDFDEQNINKFKVQKQDSLINKVDFEFAADWSYTRRVCICPKDQSSLNVVCVSTEYQICNETNKIEGELKTCHIRNRRSLERHRQNNIRLLRKREADLQKKRSYNHRITRQSGVIDQEKYEAAYLLCVQYFQKKVAFEMRDRLPNISVNASLKACALDTLIDSNDVWKQSHFQSWINLIDSEIKKNATFQKVSGNIVSEFKAVTCPDDCSQHGECINGTCLCFDDYTGPTCLVQLSAPLTIYDIEGGGVCDLALGKDCHDCLQIYTELILPNFTCKIDVYEMKKGKLFVKTNELETVGEYDSIYSGFCCPDAMDLNRKRHDLSDPADEIFATKYNIAISNDGIHFSDSSAVVVFDSTCQKYAFPENGEASVTLKENTCFIDGKCYTYGQKKMNFDCEACYPSKNSFDWTHACSEHLLDDEDSTDNDDDNSSAVVTIVAISGSIIGVLVILTGSFLLYKRKYTKRSSNNPIVNNIEDTNTINTQGGYEVLSVKLSHGSKSFPVIFPEYESLNQATVDLAIFQSSRYSTGNPTLNFQKI